jgi:NHL repeat
MTAENKSHGTLSLRNVFVVLFILIGLFLLSLWAERKSAEVKGPSRLVRGPHDTIYVQVDQSIAKVSSEGELLNVLDLGTDASVSDVADFFVQEDGRLLFARRDSRLLQYYSAEGKLLTTLLRMPPPQAGGNQSYYLTKDPATGILYLADTSHHRIRMFGPDEKEVKTIIAPSGAQASSLSDDRQEDTNLERAFSPKTPLQYPNGLTFAGDRLFVTDTGNSRVVIFYPDGTLDKIIVVFPLESSNFINPIRADRFGDTIYIVVRGRSFIGGKVQSFELHTGLPRNFAYLGSRDPWDVLVRREDVLVADRASLTVIRYAHSGRFLGIFGKAGLQNLNAESQFKRKTYEWLRIGSLASMGAIFAWLLFTSSSRFTGLQNVLGPFGSARRKMLLLIPGLGQTAAGRPLRASFLLLILLYFASLFIYSRLQYQPQVGTPMSLLVLITAGFMAYSVWIFIVLDGIRLTGKPADNERRSVAKHRRQAVSALLITLCSATAAQLAREFIVRGYPGAPPAIQQLFYFLITYTNSHSSFFAAALPASIMFGWGGAAAALFGTLAWQAKAGREEIATGIVVGFLAGIYSWLFTVVLEGNRSGWMPYVPLIQGVLLSLFTYLYFRRKGMPVLIMPVAVAGAWIGYSLKFFFGVLAVPVRKILSEGDAAGLWTGATARLELILIPAFFIHLAIWMTWNIASDGPAGNADAVIQKEDGFSVSL